MSKLVKRILVTNDDGIDAPGLVTAVNIANQLSDDVWVFAPPAMPLVWRTRCAWCSAALKASRLPGRQPIV